MKAILIDPFTRSIDEVNYSGDYREIYKLIDCDTFDIACFSHEGVDADVFVDDEGLFVEEQQFFYIEGCHSPLAGKGLVLGCNGEGDSIGSPLTLREVREIVHFGMLCKINGAVFFVPFGDEDE